MSAKGGKQTLNYRASIPSRCFAAAITAAKRLSSRKGLVGKNTKFIREYPCLAQRRGFRASANAHDFRLEAEPSDLGGTTVNLCPPPGEKRTLHNATDVRHLLNVASAGATRN